MSFTVAKFGGTSVADYSSMLRCAQIVQNNSSIRLVVVSACAGVTNRLAEIADKQGKQTESLRNEIYTIHLSIQQKLNDASDVEALLSQMHDELESHCQKPIENWAAWRDELLSFGERCSSLLFSSILKQQGTLSDTLDARQLLKTNSAFGRAQPDDVSTKSHCLEQKQKLDSGCVWVTQGFIGSNDKAQTTTLGRGGSDYSAALLAAGFNATDLQIWTDVAGIYTTDPRICSSARAIAEMSFQKRPNWQRLEQRSCIRLVWLRPSKMQFGYSLAAARMQQLVVRIFPLVLTPGLTCGRLRFVGIRL